MFIQAYGRFNKIRQKGRILLIEERDTEKPHKNLPIKWMLRISYKMQVICLVWGKYNSSIENKNRRDRSLVKPDSVWGDGKGFLPRRQDNPCLITTKIRLGKFSFGQVYFRFNSCYLVVRCHAAMFIFSLSVSKILLNHNRGTNA